jgi:hypothetical protein
VRSNSFSVVLYLLSIMLCFPCFCAAATWLSGSMSIHRSTGQLFLLAEFTVARASAQSCPRSMQICSLFWVDPRASSERPVECGLCACSGQGESHPHARPQQRTTVHGHRRLDGCMRRTRGILISRLLGHKLQD